MARKEYTESNPVERAMCELQASTAAEKEDAGYNATSVDFLKSKTFTRLFLRMSHDRTTGGTIALDQVSHLCAVAYFAGCLTVEQHGTPKKAERRAFAKRLEQITKSPALGC